MLLDAPPNADAPPDVVALLLDAPPDVGALLLDAPPDVGAVLLDAPPNADLPPNVVPDPLVPPSEPLEQPTCRSASAANKACNR